MTSAGQGPEMPPVGGAHLVFTELRLEISVKTVADTNALFWPLQIRSILCPLISTICASSPFVIFNFESFMTVLTSDKIVIVGAGCFGISTALHLLKREFTDVTVLDRSPTLPARDAASSDLNKS